MSAEISPAGYRVITVAEAEERFGVSVDVSHPYQDFADEQEIRLYEGGLGVTGGLEAAPDGDWVPYNTIVDGDLTVGGDLEWWDSASGNFLLVTGDLRARHVLLSGCPDVVVRGNLTASGTVQGSYGDDGGCLTVGGRTHAQSVISTLYFIMHFAEQPDALLITGSHSVNCPVDFTDDELDELVLPELLDKDGTADARGISAALRAGQPVLRPGIRPSHLLALDELDALLPRAEEITELDLSDRKLRRLPEQLYAFVNLRVLSLADNKAIGSLDERIGELTALEELNVSGLSLTALPESIGRLRELRVLDVSRNELEALPEQIGDLPRLEVLRAARLSCPVPDAVARLSTLRELDLSNLQPGEYDSLVPFPRAVPRLSALRRLDLSHVFLETLPDDLLALTTLEELDLRGSLSGLLPRLPDLARLPRLRVLRLNGNTPWSFQPEPDRELLSGVWDITTLEHLEIDRWGERTAGGEILRTAFTELPEDAFARMPGLRRLDLSFNELTTLPESLFRLRALEALDLRYTALDKPTADRVRAVFPHVRPDLREADDWTSSLTQAFGVLLGRPLADYDSAAGYGVYYGGNWLEETELNRDPAWLAPAALTGRETVTLDDLMLLDAVGFPALRFDASRSLFEVDATELPPAFAEDLAAASLPSFVPHIVRGDALARLLERHDLGPSASQLPEESWSVWQARIASDGTLLDALRVATGIGRGPDSLVPYTKPYVWETGTEADADAAIAGVHDTRLRAHLRTFAEPGSDTLDHQARQTKNGDWSGWQGEEWEKVGSLVTQWLGAVDQYTISVVRLDAPSGDGPGA